MESIKKIVIHEAVVTEIVKYIKENNFQKGDKLPTERDIAKLLNVSRTSVREALKILQANQVIDIRHGSGIYVLSIDNMIFSNYDTDDEYKEVLSKLKQLAQARIMIETFCSIELAKVITPEQLNNLYELENMENEILLKRQNNPNGEVFVSLNLELKITELYGNAFLNTFHKKIDELWSKYFHIIHSVPYPSALRHHDHMDIINSIKQNSKNKIEKSIRSHIERTIDALDKLIEG